MSVPIKGQKRDTLHLIDEELALRFLPSGKIQRFRLALATKPFDVFFLCHVPTRNEDNSWNVSNLQACEQAKTFWVQATTRKEEHVDAYKIDSARDPDAFPDPKWPTQTLDELIEITFTGRMIDHENHPGLAATDRRQAVGVVSKNFTTIIVCDFEYEVADGELPNVLCMVVYVLNENLQHVRTIRMWRGDFGKTPPFDIGPDALFVAYSAWAEMTCFMTLGWKFPEHIFDLHTAYLAASNVLLPYNPDEMRKRQRKSDWPTPAAPTASKVGKTSTRKPLQKTSAKAAGANTVARLS